MKKHLCINKRGKVVSKRKMLSGRKKNQATQRMVEGYCCGSKAAGTKGICCLQEGNKILQGCKGNLLQAIKYHLSYLTLKNLVACSSELNHVVLTTDNVINTMLSI